MKKVVIGAMAVLALTACSNEEVIQTNEQNNEITFTAVTGKATSRAADGYCNSNLPGDFQVWAATQGKSYFANETYSKDTDGYFKPKDGNYRYWPESGTVDFFATKNMNGSVTWTYTGTTSLAATGYTVESTPGTQKDFIYAVTKSAVKGTGTVTLNFRHALAQIEFNARNQNKKIHVFIDGVSLVNVKDKGNFSVNVATTNNYIDHDLDDAVNSDTRTGRCSWSGQDGKATYETSFTKTAVKVSTTDNTSLTTADASGEYNGNTLYVMPNNPTPWDPNGGAATATGQNDSYFLVKALIYNVSGATFNEDDDVVVWGTNDGSGTWSTKAIAIPVPASTTWEDGKRYVYTFVFTDKGNAGYNPDDNTPVLTPISLDIKIDDFVDAGSEDVEMKK